MNQRREDQAITTVAQEQDEGNIVKKAALVGGLGILALAIAKSIRDLRVKA